MLVFRAHGSQPPVFFVDWPAGGGWQLSGLISRLGEDQPCYLFVSGGIPEPWPPGTTVEQMAAAIVRSIRAVHPHGSVALVGNCYGGIIALEVARQMRGDAPVRLLVMLDIGPEDFPTLVPPEVLAKCRRNEARQRWARQWAKVAAGEWRTLIRALIAKTRPLGARVGATLTGALTGRSVEPTGRGPADLHAACERAARLHRPTPHLGDVLCFVPENAMRAVTADESSFSRLGTNVTAHLLPGDDLFVAPAIDQVATLLRHALRSHDSSDLEKVEGRAS
jgi:pimeloyl-ACP methyl ester carboxylesterase